jgi:hypothetical protein
MAVTAVGSEAILNHALLDYVLENCALPECAWARFDRHMTDRMSLLRFLPVLAGVSSYTRASAGLTVQLAALRLASFNVDTGPLLRPGRQKARAVLRQFDRNVSLLRKSWQLPRNLPLKLRNSALDDLSASELHELQRILLGFSMEITVRPGDGQAASPNIWVTPASR